MEKYHALSTSEPRLNEYRLIEENMKEGASSSSGFPKWEKAPTVRQFYLSNPYGGREPIPEHIPEHHEGGSLTCRRICCCPFVLPFFLIGTAGGAVLGILTVLKNLGEVMVTSAKCCILCPLVTLVPALLILPFDLAWGLIYGITTGGCKLVARALDTSIDIPDFPSLMKMYDEWLEKKSEQFQNRRAHQYQPI